MKTAVAVLLSLVCAACASVPEQSAQPREEKVYRTGSNLPVRDPSAVSEVKNVDPESVRRALSIGGRPGSP